jgi:RecF/RecN/SMC N terminal domain
MRLKTLRARSVRGIPRTWPDVPIGPKGLVVYGPNGVGKSSIVDALEFALTSQSSLFPENRQGVSWESAAPHVRHGQPHMAVEIEESGVTTLIDSTTREEGSSSAVRDWISVARTANFVLRRHMLLRFISEQPRERYQLLEPFLNLGSYQDMETALRDWSGRLQTNAGIAAGAISQYEHRLRQIFRLSAGATVTQQALLDELNAILANAGLAGCTGFDALEDSKRQVEGNLGGKERSQRLAALGGLKASVQRLGRLDAYIESIQNLYSAVHALEQQVAGRTTDLLADLLGTAKETIEAEQLTLCPVCEQRIDTAKVLARIQERIDTDQRVRAAKGLVADRRQALARVVSPLKSALTSLRGEWSEIVKAVLPDSYGQVESLVDELDAHLAEPTLRSEILHVILDRARVSETPHERLVEQLDALIVAEGGGERLAHLHDAKLAIDALANDWAEYGKRRAELDAIVRQRAIVGRLLEHAAEARKEAIQATLDTVSETANRMYERIHPKESIATSKLFVRQVGQGSVNLSTAFDGREEPPLLHLSESHLDTLGLCYFLALRRHEAEDRTIFKVLVLDDVLHSVDGSHRGRVARLIREEFPDHQLVITTHDQHFYDVLRRILGVAGYSYQFITDWDIEHGPILSDPSSDLDRIVDETKRKASRPDDLSAIGGRFFEWLLKELAESLEIAVPARFQRKHDIGSLWPATAAKLRKHKSFASANPRLVGDLDGTSWVRNACGAHHNDSASGVTPQETQEFAGQLASLYRATHCEKCQTIIATQSNEDWRCECGDLRYPAKVEVKQQTCESPAQQT